MITGDVRQNRASLTPVSSANIVNDGTAYLTRGLNHPHIRNAVIANQRHRYSARLGRRVNSHTGQKKTNAIPSGAISTVSEKSCP